MAQIDVEVDWDSSTNQPTVNLDPIPVPTSNGATVIKWKAKKDSGITNLQISGLDSNEFTIHDNNPENEYKVTDKNDEIGSFSYTITADHSSGLKGRRDPEIENGGSPLP
jgi:hypothetical protein